MFKTTKFYFLPFWDNLSAVLITFLVLFLFGNWLSNTTFATIITFLLLFILCSRIYVRMWTLSRKNSRYGYNLTQNNFKKFILPLVIFDFVIIIFYCLCKLNIIPLQDIVVASFYNFPDNAPRELVKISAFDYVIPFVKVWFAYMFYFADNYFMLFLAPVLSFISAFLGFKLGKEDKHITNFFIKMLKKEKIKE